MRHGVAVLVLSAVLLSSGCSDDPPEAAPAVVTPTATAVPAYDATLEPAAAVLALVPDGARTLAVTDFDQVRAELGVDEVGDQSTPAEVAAFWQRADAERPLLTTGMLRPDDDRLRSTHGFSSLDVAWEAHFSGADGQEQGWVLAFRDGTDMAGVAAAAQEPTGPLRGADVDAAARLVTSGAAADPEQSWAADPELVALVGQPANATYVARDCDGAAGDAGAAGDLDELGPFSVQLEGSLATARLGEGRHDLFARMRLGEAEPGFAAAYDGGVADPVTGRIGYVMTDPPAAARLALAHALPFATCASG